MKLEKRLLCLVPLRDFFRLCINRKIERKKYTDFTFTFLSKLLNEFIRFLLDISIHLFLYKQSKI